MQMYFERRLMSSEERNHEVTVAARLGGNRAWCPVARVTLPSEIDNDVKGHINHTVGGEADQA
jgi:hypothetical protein